jgi:hypothetical protein
MGHVLGTRRAKPFITKADTPVNQMLDPRAFGRVHTIHTSSLPFDDCVYRKNKDDGR